MRLLAIALLFAFAVPVFGADKDEDKAKEVALAFLKAFKAKDLDAIMKTVDVPFLSDEKGENKVIEKVEDLKANVKMRLEKFKDTSKITSEVGKVMDLADIKKLLESKKGKNDELAKIEKVLGDKGYAVMLGKPGEEDGAVLVRIKDGKAAVVGVPR